MVPAVEAATISPASGLASPSSRLMTWNVLISAGAAAGAGHRTGWRRRTQRHVKAVLLRTHEVGDTGLFERVPETGIHGVGRNVTVLAVIRQSHQKVLTQSTGKQMATGTDQGDGSGERLSGRVGYLDVVQRKRFLVSGQRAGKQRGSRGFAGTGDADDGGELTGGRQ